MKSTKEITEKLFKRRDEYVKRKKKTQKITISVISICLVLVIGIGLWQFDLYKTSPIDTTSDNDVVSSQETESNDNVQSNVVSEPTESKSPIEQSVPSAQDIPTEVGGSMSWWFAWKYEYNYIEDSGSYLQLLLDDEERNNWHQQFWTVNKETYTRVESVGIIGAVDEFGITKEQFVNAISEHGAIVDGRYYAVPGYVNAPIDDAGSERWWYLTQEEVDLIFSADKELRDQKLRSRYTAYANGEIYTPRWICLHTAEDYIAAGLTKEQMMETVSTWNHVGVPIVVEPNGDVWQDAERFKKVLEYVKIEIDKMP